MPTKKLIIIGTVLLLVAMMILAQAESVSGGSTGQPAGLEKNLPTEERIPTH